MKIKNFQVLKCTEIALTFVHLRRNVMKYVPPSASQLKKNRIYGMKQKAYFGLLFMLRIFFFTLKQRSTLTIPRKILLPTLSSAKHIYIPKIYS